MASEKQIKWRKRAMFLMRLSGFHFEQMKELEAMGIDCSNASCIWHSYTDKDYNPVSWIPIYRGEDKIGLEQLRKAFPYTYKEGNIHYAFTLEDILKLLNLSKFNIDIDLANYNGKWYIALQITSLDAYESELYFESIDAAFEGLKWAKNNNYI